MVQFFHAVADRLLQLFDEQKLPGRLRGGLQRAGCQQRFQPGEALALLGDQFAVEGFEAPEVARVERLDVLRQRVAQLNAEIQTLAAERVTLAERLGLTTYSDSTVNPYDTTLAQSRERLAAVVLERAPLDVLELWVRAEATHPELNALAAQAAALAVERDRR